jgi:hypothetical protein
VADHTDRPLRVLLLEDDPDDEVLVRQALVRADLEFELKRVHTRQHFERGLGWKPDGDPRRHVQMMAPDEAGP